MAGTRRLLSRLRDVMASGTAPLTELTELVAAELVAEVCSIYAMRPGEILELVATHGLRQHSIGRTRLRVGEGIVGICAATAKPMNLSDVQNHPAYAYRPETGEDLYASMCAVPVRRSGHSLGVLAVQNHASRRYSAEEVEVLETVAMLLAEMLATAGATDGAEGVSDTLPRQFAATKLAPGIAVGPVIAASFGAAPRHFLSDDPAVEITRLHQALETMRRELDILIEDRLPDGDAPREVLEATRLVAADNGWLKRVSEAIRGGLTAESAVHRVAGELRERMRRIADPYLRERLADLEDMAGRILLALGDGTDLQSVPPGAILVLRRLGPAQLLDWHARGVAGVVIEEGSPSGHAAIVARALGIPALGGARGLLEALQAGDDAILDADEGQVILRPDGDVRTAYERASEGRAQRKAGWAALRCEPAVTADGTGLSLMLNVGLALELDQLDLTGAAGIGLFRTEIAMLARG